MTLHEQFVLLYMLRASCPSDRRARNRCREGSLTCICTWLFTEVLPLKPDAWFHRGCLIPAARAPPSLGGTRYARSDTIRTPLGFPVEDTLGCSLKSDSLKPVPWFPASCPYRIRLASLPSRPSFARRPCLAISVHSFLTCTNGPSDSNREHFQPDWLASMANPLQAESIGTFTQVPPDLKRFYFGHVHCPAVFGFPYCATL
jgi:hypothetical protein